MDGTPVRWRRWALVAAAVLALLAGGVVVQALPAASSSIEAGELRSRVLASAGRPYSAYAESTGLLGLPALPAFDEVADLLSSTTRVRAWYADPDHWRVDTLEFAGERSIYRDGRREVVHDFERQQVLALQPLPPVRLPRAADLVAPELARRLLALGEGDPVARLPSRRIAGISAAGLRLTPRDPDTTVGAVDVWADAGTGLPLRVEVTARGEDRPALVSTLLEVDQGVPPAHVLAPPTRPGADVELTDFADALDRLGTAPTTPRLAGRDRVQPASVAPNIALYGNGISRFVVAPLPRGLANEALRRARDAGAAELRLAGGASAARVQTSLLTLVVLRVPRSGGYLLAGAVTAPVLEAAAAELAAAPRGSR